MNISYPLKVQVANLNPLGSLATRQKKNEHYLSTTGGAKDSVSIAPFSNSISILPTFTLLINGSKMPNIIKEKHMKVKVYNWVSLSTSNQKRARQVARSPVPATFQY